MIEKQPFFRTQSRTLTNLLVKYYEEGGYQRDLTAICDEARSYLATLPKPVGKQAIVLDIDETSLQNPWKFMNPKVLSNDEQWSAWHTKAEAKAIQPTLELYQEAIEKGFTVFFITGRDPSKASCTKENLIKEGFDQWEQVFFNPIHGTPPEPTSLVFPEATTYKTTVRWGIASQGYRIVLNMGDQVSDLVGGFADRTFQLPNPFYTIL